jgi:hypothetical protein
MPVTVRENVPMPTLAGLMPARIGVGLSRVTALEPTALLSAELVARMVTVLGFGSAEGAV